MKYRDVGRHLPSSKSDQAQSTDILNPWPERCVGYTTLWWSGVSFLFCPHDGVSTAITGSPDGGLKYGIVRM